jgi:rubrerythrin
MEIEKETRTMTIHVPALPAFVGLEEVDAPTPGPAKRSEMEELLDRLEAHEREEAEVLAEYGQAVAHAPDAGFRFLMDLVVEDEERHERLSKAMTAEVRQSLLWLRGEPPIPAVAPAPQARQQLLQQTERYLQIERDGERQLDDLQHQVKGLYEGRLELIVDIMRAETRKHTRILEYIRAQLEAA